MNPSPRNRLALACLFTALCGAGAFISLPFPGSPVPLVVQNLFVVLAGLLLGPVEGLASVVLFLVLGALGFPVFAGGRGGLAHFAGPTGGYLIGYLAAAVLAGLLARRRGLAGTIAGAAVGFLVILAFGALRLKFLKNVGWGKAAAIGILPFLIGDGIKAVIAVLLSLRLGRLADSLRGEAAT
jgi:biotin transport system substrate-specific component